VPSSRLQEFVDNCGEYPEGVEMLWENNEMMRERILNVLIKYINYKKVIVVCHGILIRSLKPWDQNHFPECGEIVEYEYK
jgi:broad specificity phosphatase PhoE